MPHYTAPLRDMRFVLHELHNSADLAQLPGFEDMTADLIDPVLEEAGKFASEVLQPLNQRGDEEGCRYEDGQVYTPQGFKQAYDQFAEGGWTGISCDPAHGGQGMPVSVHMMIEEMISSANLAFGLYPGLSHGAYKAINAHATPALRDTFLPRMADGSWGGTMCLTEPHCGTDLGLIRSKAVAQPDGSYRVTGTKIFISSGEHDLTENNIHLVLARIEGAPKGIKGISLFVVPKFLVNEDGSLGERNTVTCGSIEHKMGIKASATCVMNFDDAKGWLIGVENKGMRAMFTMMNAARQGVAIQGLGVAEAAYQGAVSYARERLQGRALSGPRHPDKPADPLMVHPDVRRLLLTMRANIEGARALGAWVSKALDIADKSPDPAVRQDADDLVALMTPVLKSCFTDMGLACANMGMQVFGGHGYIREHGMEQLVRDARITLIYEGTNGVQALDLVGRKLPAHGGRLLRQFFHPVSRFIEDHAEDPQLGVFAKQLGKAFGHLQQATIHIMKLGMARPEEGGAASTDYLRLFSLVALGYMWARMAQVSIPCVGTEQDAGGFYRAKVGTARFYFERLLPETGARRSAILAGGSSILSFDDNWF
ncbi:acyl-CoA dehydrogenase C-terminal domain-containing protein [Allopusillimonas ginsengisoli]|uniref:acyl-CoA dehydrogenase C-terminal domain-containing protein n=1 Tax=Allopusillimonas ginsengisoli TaxID=453575 RepID=UPI00101F56A7|nr:acyl-CoA dehydrogenase C-terminal domain-containing protein [Allopusillimonas ginsengisoli]TEA76810.1 acyl-CoA dehydrogenase [Allopusillimonas ginsengisoli]